MSQDKSKEFSLDDLDDLSLDESGENPDVSAVDDDGFELDLSEDLAELDLSDEENQSQESGNLNEFSLTNVELSLPAQEAIEDSESDDVANFNEIDLGDDSDKFALSDESLLVSEEDVDAGHGPDLNFDVELDADLDFAAVADDALFDGLGDDLSDPLEDYSSPKLDIGTEDLTEDVKAKLKEIDAIMEEDATQSALKLSEMDLGYSEDESIVGDVDIENLHLDEEVQVNETPAPKKKKKKEETAVASASLEEISQAYTGEMERTQATIANLRADRDELLKKIEYLEEEKLLSSRNTLTMRAELDEKKIELTIIRKKLNEEIHELKDKIHLFEEKVLILEEKNKHFIQELDKAGQKNKIDVKRVMLRERELEQRLELLKADAETQIRNRDLKILELKRRIDAMEFDMESMTQQEKKTLESRFELEDKLDRAIRTLRTAISNLEEEGGRSATLDTLKKNVEM